MIKKHDNSHKNTIRLMILVQHLAPGGIESLALDFLAHMPGCETLLVSLEGNKQDAVDHWPRLKPHVDQVVWLDKKPGWDLRCFFRLTKLARRFKPDIIHSHHIGPLIYGGVAAKSIGCPMVHTEHDAWHLDDDKRKNLQNLGLSLFNPVVVADARMVAHQFQRVLNRKADHVIINGIDTDRFIPQDREEARAIFNLPQDRHIIGVAGRLVPVKRITALVEAFHFARRSDLHLAIAGTGPLHDTLANMISAYGLDNRISLLGHVDDMPQFYNALNHFILPSEREGLPLSLLEAQACGVQVLATNVGGVKEAVCPTTGALIEDISLPALVRALEGIKPHLSGVISPRQFVTQNGSRTIMFDQYAKAYQDAMT